MNIKWSDSLNKSEIDNWLIEEIEEDTETGIPESLLNVLKQKIKTTSDINNLEKTIKELRNYISEEHIDTLEDEFDEIKKDFKWASTEKGKNTLTINDWVQQFYTEFRSFKEFDNAYIGGHAEKNVISVFGKVQNKEVEEKLRNYVKSKEPPFEVLFKIEIST